MRWCNDERTVIPVVGIGLISCPLNHWLQGRETQAATNKAFKPITQKIVSIQVLR
jgi:hypothetical protein